eukprot:463420-Rhodomonas_salina.1
MRLPTPSSNLALVQCAEVGVWAETSGCRTLARKCRTTKASWYPPSSGSSAQHPIPRGVCASLRRGAPQLTRWFSS